MDSQQVDYAVGTRFTRTCSLFAHPCLAPCSLG